MGLTTSWMSVLRCRSWIGGQPPNPRDIERNKKVRALCVLSRTLPRWAGWNSFGSHPHQVPHLKHAVTCLQPQEPCRCESVLPRAPHSRDVRPSHRCGRSQQARPAWPCDAPALPRAGPLPATEATSGQFQSGWVVQEITIPRTREQTHIGQPAAH